ncbi:hypothetical protein KI387_000240, partial [Taxus chinensis]
NKGRIPQKNHFPRKKGGQKMLKRVKNPTPGRLSMRAEPKEMKKSLNVVAERAEQWGSSQKNKAFSHGKPLMKNAPKK